MSFDPETQADIHDNASKGKTFHKRCVDSGATQPLCKRVLIADEH